MSRIALFALTCVLTVPSPAYAADRNDSIVQRPRELLLASLKFGDALWNESTGLARSPLPDEQELHRTRESTWYALGLLQRDAPGDRDRARRILELVLTHQITAPGQRWDGTFRRFLEEPLPGPGAVLWDDYDPNWRHFIGTTFALILEQYSSRLPAELPAKLEDSIRRAVEGELTQGREEPYHTNIKLMHGFLWSWAGARLGQPEWIAGGEGWAQEVAAAFAVNQSFEEYNSPTYYGVDLYGLALWRQFGATKKIRALGAELETGLWRDIARFYHAGLRNLCGPYDRAYGMDMRRYVSLVGVWMGLALPAELTPLPDPAGPMGHAHDFLCTPTYVTLGVDIPDDVLASFREFSGERTLRRPIEGPRIATAWLDRDLMFGGEITGATRAAGPDTAYNQYHPATMHWRTPNGDLGWVRLFSAPACDAAAEPGTLTITAPVDGEFVFWIHAPELSAAEIAREHWTLSGMTLSMDTDAADFRIVQRDDGLEVRYSGATRLVFARTPASSERSIARNNHEVSDGTISE